MAAVMAAPEAVAAPSSLLLLVVGGECGCPGLLAHILEELERGGAAGTGAAAAGRGGAFGWGWGFRRAGVRVGRSDPDATFRAAGSSCARQPLGSSWRRGSLGLGGGAAAWAPCGAGQVGRRVPGVQGPGGGLGPRWAPHPRLWGSGGVRPSSSDPARRRARTFPRGAPGPAFPAANWRVGGAAAPGELGTRGTDSGAPVTLGHGRGCIACNGAVSAMHVPVTHALRS